MASLTRIEQVIPAGFNPDGSEGAVEIWHDSYKGTAPFEIVIRQPLWRPFPNRGRVWSLRDAIRVADEAITKMAELKAQGGPRVMIGETCFLVVGPDSEAA